jgi:WD40 repeat protein/serine/threonine protein kinase/tetratricopeptide (TPR) repeat protein
MSDSTNSERHPVEALAEDFLDRFRRGERPALSEYTRKHPDLADEIRDLFPALVMLEDVGPVAASHSSAHGSQASPPKLERLGDYRILREVGRGGMGVVYEAEQESLGRHVALKVLGAHTLLDPRHLQRFQREARAAARLHHTNIVPVFGVGEHEGLHYYVMQFIHGQGLDQVLAELVWMRQSTAVATPGARPTASPPPPADHGVDAASAVWVARSLLTGVFARAVTGLADSDPVPAVPEASVPDTNRVRLDTEIRWPGQAPKKALTDSSRQYWQSVARIGIQVADALAYAHSQNTLHRDIKPANLLLDTQGIVWVTDFGLAKASDSENLTHTGDVVGTLRYMAPERFSGKADARSDIYALGLTLYELVTLRPAFAASERSTLVHQVMSKEPARPRKLNPAMPRDLETIVLKAISRDPGHRYQTAVELADDLKRFLDDKPIQARPVSEIEKLWRWCRRNPAVALLAGAVVLALLIGMAGTAWKWHEAELRRQDADREKQKVISAQNDTQRVLAGIMLDKGVALAEQGETAEGLFWMLEGLKAVPQDAHDLQRVLRTNLAAWQCQSHGLQQMMEQPGAVWCAFTPDGRGVLTASGGEVWTWDLATGQRLGKAIAQPHMTTWALSADGQILATAGSSKGSAAAHLRNAATGEPLGQGLPHSAWITAMEFVPSGKQLATVCADGTLRLWDVAAGMLVGTPMNHDQHATWCLAVSPDGKTVATGSRLERESDPSAVYLWDLATGQRKGPALAHKGSVFSVAFSPDGQQLVTGCADAMARVWDLATATTVGPGLQHPHAVLQAKFTPDGRTIATGSRDGIVRWWDAGRHTQLVGVLHADHRQIVTLALSRDGRRLATATHDNGSGLVQVLQLARAATRPSTTSNAGLLKAPWLEGEGTNWFTRHFVSYSPDGTRVLTGGNLHYGFLSDTVTGQPAVCANGPGGPLWNTYFGIHVTAISPDGRILATSSRNATAVGEVRLWDAATCRPLGAPLPHDNFVSALAFSPDAKMLVTGCYDSTVRFWDTTTGKRLGAPLPQLDIVVSLAISPDGKTLAVGHSLDHTGTTGVVLWDLAGRKQIGEHMLGPSNQIKFSPDGRYLVGTGWSQLRLWDPATSRPVGQPITELAEINNAEFSPESQALLVTMTDGTLRLRDLATGKHIGSLMPSPVRAIGAAFSRDGKFIVAGYADGSARLWDRATQKPLGPPMVQGRPIMNVTFMPDGLAYLTTADDGTTRHWRVPAPADEPWERLQVRLEVRTGLHMSEGQVVVKLGPKAWQEHRQKLIALEGAAASALAAGISDDNFHDARARDAEQDNHPAAARWHLDRMIEVQSGEPGPGSPPIWLAFMRRARTWTAQEHFDQADSDYAAVLKHVSQVELSTWYRQCTVDCQRGEQWSTALWYLNRAVALAPDDWRLYAGRAQVLGKLGKDKEREADLKKVVERAPDSLILVQLAEEYAVAGKWDEAGQAFAMAAARDLHLLPAWHHFGLVSLQRGDRQAYRDICAKLVLEEVTSIGAANSVAWACAMGPEGLGDYQRPIELAERAVSKVPQESRHGVLNTLGAILYRAGRYQDAVQRLQEGIQISKSDGSVHDWYFLAMAYHRLGDADLARKYLTQATARPLPLTPFSWDNLELDLLRREAVALIGEAKLPLEPNKR